MRHDVTLEGWNCRLRPVKMDDAKFIVDLRVQDYVQQAVHYTDPSVAKQEEWLRRYFARENDYYWIVENTQLNRCVGTMGLYDFVGQDAMPGRIVMLRDADIVISIVPFLVCEFAFEALKVRRLVGDTLKSNLKIQKINELFGFVRMETRPPQYEGKELGLDLIWWELKASNWPDIKQKWLRMLGDRAVVGI